MAAQPHFELADLVGALADEGAQLIQHVQPFTMTSPERIEALRQSVEYIIRTEIPGDMVECGVWRGGSMMAIALTLMRHGAHARRLHLFDTFNGMPEPSHRDRDFADVPAVQILAQDARNTTSYFWGYCPLEDVRNNMRSTGYPDEHIEYIVGRVEDTLPERAPARIALLRLDTDWYESTHHELFHLYPLLSTGGILIVDDYGHWKGARDAVDDYIRERDLKILLSPIDYTGRLAVKVESS